MLDRWDVIRIESQVSAAYSYIAMVVRIECKNVLFPYWRYFGVARVGPLPCARFARFGPNIEFPYFT